MKIVYVDIVVVNHRGQVSLAAGGSFIHDGAKLLPNDDGRTWRDLFEKVFLPSPLVESLPDVESGNDKTLTLWAEDLYRNHKAPPETRRRYGAPFKVLVKGQTIGWEGDEGCETLIKSGDYDEDDPRCPQCGGAVGANRLKIAFKMIKLLGQCVTITGRCGHKIKIDEPSENLDNADIDKR